ncbi:hypothetical protein [Aliiroseovarius sp. 2305UL8-7]|uniref:hypothetical protein n=1 Tax=Aliiroseovarius conchicola TaxID=3121637 RepID=UPI0035271B26
MTIQGPATVLLAQGLFFSDPRPQIALMSKTKFVLLITLVILAGGLTVLVAGLAAVSGKLDGQVAMAILPLVMLASIAIRGLTGKNDQ